MTDRDRLIELLKDTPMLDVLYGQDEDWESAADYLLANGVIVPPCKVGDTVYRPSKYLGYVVPFLIISFEATQSEMFYTDDSDNIIYIGEIGETVFLTKEEAEKKLKELEDNVRND